MYNTNSQIKFKTSWLKSSLCDYNDVYILVEDLYQAQKQQPLVQMQIIMIGK